MSDPNDVLAAELLAVDNLRAFVELSHDIDEPEVHQSVGLLLHIDRLTRELAAARAENARLREDEARWPDTESLASQVLDEVESAIASGRAMGHGAYAIVHRLRRLLAPSQRADTQGRPR